MIHAGNRQCFSTIELSPFYSPALCLMKSATLYWYAIPQCVQFIGVLERKRPK
jgi:hypothetical protein